jgi:hypothetical protein
MRELSGLICANKDAKRISPILGASSQHTEGVNWEKIVVAITCNDKWSAWPWSL